MTTIASVAEHGQKKHHLLPACLLSGYFVCDFNWNTRSNWRLAYPPAITNKCRQLVSSLEKGKTCGKMCSKDNSSMEEFGTCNANVGKIKSILMTNETDWQFLEIKRSVRPTHCDLEGAKRRLKNVLRSLQNGLSSFQTNNRTTMDAVFFHLIDQHPFQLSDR